MVVAQLENVARMSYHTRDLECKSCLCSLRSKTCMRCGVCYIRDLKSTIFKSRITTFSPAETSPTLCTRILVHFICRSLMYEMRTLAQDIDVLINLAIYRVCRQFLQQCNVKRTGNAITLAPAAALSSPRKEENAPPFSSLRYPPIFFTSSRDHRRASKEPVTMSLARWLRRWSWRKTRKTPKRSTLQRCVFVSLSCSVSSSFVAVAVGGGVAAAAVVGIAGVACFRDHLFDRTMVNTSP